jgi:hypothetical protein
MVPQTQFNSQGGRKTEGYTNNPGYGKTRHRKTRIRPVSRIFNLLIDSAKMPSRSSAEVFYGARRIAGP